MGEFSFAELLVIVVIAILIYGKDLPQAARKLAGIYSRFRRHLADIKDEIHRQIPAEEIQNSMKMDLSTPTIDPPPTPTGLAGTASGTQVVLTWNSSPGATSYTLKRSTAREDPFAIINDYVTDLSHTDWDVKEGTTYYYVVSASNTAGESANSDEVAVTIAPAAAPQAADAPAGSPPAAAAGNGSGAAEAAAGGNGTAPAPPLSPSPSIPANAAGPAAAVDPPAAP
jgi:Sec-independent protein translocase protein TatA